MRKRIKTTENTKDKVKARIRTMSVLFILVFVALSLRIAYIQFIWGPTLAREALEQQTRDREISAKRGTIYDRNGKQLAVSADVETVGLTPADVRKSGKASEYAQKLAKILELDEKDVMDKINAKVSYVVLKKKVEKETADKIRALKMQGISIDEDTKRYYPYNNIASHIIGFSGDDNQGLLGIEMIYDSKLKGRNGRIVTAKNAAGSEMPYKYDRYYSAQDGCDVTLTIDVTIQHFLEKHLEQAIIDYDVKEGTAGIIMDVKTGEILAMATKPDFNLNEPFKIYSTETENAIKNAKDNKEKNEIRSNYLNQLWRNKAVVDSYEPGSTFKIITSAMALEEGVVTVNDHFNCIGYHTVADRRIHCWKTAGHGSQTFVEALMNSCNPAFMITGAKIGKDKFYKYYKGFGFTQTTGIELNGETSGAFYPLNNFNEVELATASFGQGPTVTPLQMLAAIGAVANDGKLLKPHLLKSITDSQGNVIEEKETDVVRQVVSEQTSQIMRGTLERVVSDGTGGQAYLEGFRIGGKTGTSEKIPRGSNKYVASFAGIAPSDDPQVVLILMLDEPQGVHTGGATAAPLAGKILDDVLRYMGLEPQTTEVKDGETVVPDVVTMSVADAQEELNRLGLRCITEGDGNIVNIQIPKADTVLAEGGTVIIYTGDAKPSNSVKMPNVTGKNYYEVKEVLENNKLVLNAVGIEGNTDSVKSVSQGVPKGEYVTQGTQITVEFKDTSAFEENNTSQNQ